MIHGFAAQETGDFPSPPVSPTDLQTALTAYQVARDTAVATQSAAGQATAAKNEALQALIDGMKADLPAATRHWAAA